VTRKLPHLHAITNNEVLALPDFETRLRHVKAVPGFAVHIRSGSLGGRRLFELADSAQRAGPSGTIFVNDRADVARIVGAAGLHLPSAGFSIEAARTIVGPSCWIGRSAHTADEVRRAADEGADYVFFGPVWATSSHPDTQPLGPNALAVHSTIPMIAIGGITAEKVPLCLERGAYGVAVISALWSASDVTSAARAFSLSFPP